MIAPLSTLKLNKVRKQGKNKMRKKIRTDGGRGSVCVCGGVGSVLSKLPLNVRTLQGTLELIGAE